MAHILVVEDDADINRILCRYLEKVNYETTAAFSGSEAKLLLSMKTFDLILLDLMLPGINGEELVADIRISSVIPIIIISAKSALEDRVKLLKAGADDYLVKPFEREEVLARVEALLRRSREFAVKTPDNNEISFKELTVRPISREVFVKGNLIGLTSHEYEILNLLLRHPEQVFTKEQLYQDIWKNGYYGEDNTINVHISNIRKKIKDFDEASYIRTVWGIGYKMDTAS